MRRVVVVGAGIAGLTAAWTIAGRDRDLDVLLVEASPVLGGKLRLDRVAGIEVDVGAEALLARRGEGVGLIDELGLSGDLITPLTTAAQLRVGGRRVPLPARTMLGIPADADAVQASGALSAAALQRVVAEPSAAPLPALDHDVTVGALVRERLGSEVLDRLVEPLLGGVYAGRADELSLRATMPALAAQLQRCGGSLVAAAAAVTDTGARDPAAGPVFVSLKTGLGALPEAIARGGRFTVATSTTVRSLRRSARGFELLCGQQAQPELLQADAVVLATPAAKTAQLLVEVAPLAAAELGTVRSASVALVTLAYQTVTPPPGSGLLVGVREGFAVKAVTLSSQKWPLHTGGIVVLRASVGRAGEVQALQRDDGELVSLVRHELQALIDIDSDPIDAIVTRWGGGLPQYGLGHVEMVARVRSAVAGVGGLAVCGATYDGVGIPACIASARLAAEQVLGYLDQRPARRAEEDAAAGTP